jgi:4-alpha-glucanotransferase
MKRTQKEFLSALHELARLNGVQTSYLDMTQCRRDSSPESLLAVLRTLGVPISHLRDVPSVLHEARRARFQRAIEPVQVAWQGKRPVIRLKLPDRASAGPMLCEWRLESGEVRRSETRLEQLRVARRARFDGKRFVTRELPVPAKLPIGSHRISLECGNDRFETRLLCAQERCFNPKTSRRDWGVFAPLYALHSERSWGAGDFGDLAEFISWVGKQGGSLVGTLPLLPTFLKQPFEPSPYSPVSRLFWNEFYLDMDQVPELQKCPAARRVMQSAVFQGRQQKVRKSSLVDYARQMALKREVLELLSRAFFAKPSVRHTVFEKFLCQHPDVKDYARFRAAQEQRNEPWSQWPNRMRTGGLRAGDCRSAVEQYHLYVQWLAHDQMARLSENARSQGVELYLDLPLGTHRDGYDAWRHQDAFALAASGGAPPDPVFTQGQDWGFAPLHPRRSREEGHAYFAACVRHHLRHAGMLRFDHVMGLHRLYWVPNGLSARHGAYVSYPAEEFYAILSIESHRHRAVIVGENLGTVPREVNRSLKRHGVGGMYVAQYEFRPPPGPVLRAVPMYAVASLNTHDMVPFQAWLQGLDIEDRLQLGLLKKTDMPREMQTRKRIARRLRKILQQRHGLGQNTNDAGAVSRALLAHLAASPAKWELVNLEDLWRETLSQNVPGTSIERVNWRRKARLSLEQLKRDPAVLEQLQLVRRQRLKRR